MEGKSFQISDLHRKRLRSNRDKTVWGGGINPPPQPARVKSGVLVTTIGVAVPTITIYLVHTMNFDCNNLGQSHLFTRHIPKHYLIVTWDFVV